MRGPYSDRMARPRRARVDDVHEIAASLPGVKRVEEGKAVYQVSGRSFVFFRNPRPDAFDPETGERYDDVIVFWVADDGAKQEILAEEETPFFTTPHFNGHPSVLLRASRIGTSTATSSPRPCTTPGWAGPRRPRRRGGWPSAVSTEPGRQPRSAVPMASSSRTVHGWSSSTNAAGLPTGARTSATSPAA